jgi:hypothetical protein
MRDIGCARRPLQGQGAREALRSAFACGRVTQRVDVHVAHGVSKG